VSKSTTTSSPSERSAGSATKALSPFSALLNAVTGAESRPVQMASRESGSGDKLTGSKKDKEGSESASKKSAMDSSEARETVPTIPTLPTEPVAVPTLSAGLSPEPPKLSESEPADQPTSVLSTPSLGMEESGIRRVGPSTISAVQVRDLASYQPLALEPTSTSVGKEEKGNDQTKESLDPRSADTLQNGAPSETGSATTDSRTVQQTPLPSRFDPEMLAKPDLEPPAKIPSPAPLMDQRSRPEIKGTQDSPYADQSSVAAAPAPTLSNQRGADEARTAVNLSMATPIENRSSSLPPSADSKRVGSIGKASESKTVRRSPAAATEVEDLKPEHANHGDASTETSPSAVDQSSSQDRHENPDSQSQQSMQPAAPATPSATTMPHIHHPQSALDSSSAAPKSTSAPVDATAVKYDLQPEELSWVSGINTAHVMHAVSQSEMRVGMNTAEFGEIAVHTAISQQQILARISVDHRELSGMIASHATALATKLGSDYGVQASIEVKQAASSFSSDRQQSQQQEQRPQTSTKTIVTHPEQAFNHVQVERQPLLHESYRLDIRV